jgi:hypothetical protein
MKFIFQLLCVAFIVISCNNNENNEELKIYEESMVVHDELMARMDKLIRLRQKLETRLDSLSKDSVANASIVPKVRMAIANLRQTDDSMMDWMRNIQDVPGLDASMDHAHHGGHGKSALPNEALTVQILKDQNARIKEIREALVKNIEEAERLLIQP